MDKETFLKLNSFINSLPPPDFPAEQQQALNGEIPMTYDLFLACLRTCSEDGNLKAFFDMFEKFPEQADTWLNMLDEELDAVDKHLEEKGLKASPEEIQEHWDKFRNDVRNIFGDEEADKLPLTAPNKKRKTQ